MSTSPTDPAVTKFVEAITGTTADGRWIDSSTGKPGAGSDSSEAAPGRALGRHRFAFVRAAVEGFASALSAPGVPPGAPAPEQTAGVSAVSTSEGATEGAIGALVDEVVAALRAMPIDEGAQGLARFLEERRLSFHSLDTLRGVLSREALRQHVDIAGPHFPDELWKRLGYVAGFMGAQHAVKPAAEAGEWSTLIDGLARQRAAAVQAGQYRSNAAADVVKVALAREGGRGWLALYRLVSVKGAAPYPPREKHDEPLDTDESAIKRYPVSVPEVEGLRLEHEALQASHAALVKRVREASGILDSSVTEPTASAEGVPAAVKNWAWSGEPRSVASYIEEHFRGDFTIGETLTPVLLHLLADLRERRAAPPPPADALDLDDETRGWLRNNPQLVHEPGHDGKIWLSIIVPLQAQQMMGIVPHPDMLELRTVRMTAGDARNVRAQIDRLLPQSALAIVTDELRAAIFRIGKLLAPRELGPSVERVVQIAEETAAKRGEAHKEIRRLLTELADEQRAHARTQGRSPGESAVAATHRWRDDPTCGVCHDCDVNGDTALTRICPAATGEARGQVLARLEAEAAAHAKTLERLPMACAPIDLTHRWRATHINGFCLDCDIDGDSFDHRVCPAASGEARDAMLALLAEVGAHRDELDADLVLAADEIAHLTWQRDMLQAKGIELVERAQAAESLPRVAVAIIVYRADGKVLVMQRADGNWCHPGGRVEPGERIRRCAARELEEETGIVVHEEAIEFVPFWSHEGTDPMKTFLIVWCRVVVGVSTEGAIAEPDVFTAARWCSREEGWPTPLLMGSATMVASSEVNPWQE